MDRIDKTSDDIATIVMEGNEIPDAIIFGIIIDKINEIIEWINKQ